MNLQEYTETYDLVDAMYLDDILNILQKQESVVYDIDQVKKTVPSRVESLAYSQFDKFYVQLEYVSELKAPPSGFVVFGQNMQLLFVQRGLLIPFNILFITNLGVYQITHKQTDITLQNLLDNKYINRQYGFVSQYINYNKNQFVNIMKVQLPFSLQQTTFQYNGKLIQLQEMPLHEYQRAKYEYANLEHIKYEDVQHPVIDLTIQKCNTQQLPYFCNNTCNYNLYSNLRFVPEYNEMLMRLNIIFIDDTEQLIAELNNKYILIGSKRTKLVYNDYLLFIIILEAISNGKLIEIQEKHYKTLIMISSLISDCKYNKLFIIMDSARNDLIKMKNIRKGTLPYQQLVQDIKDEFNHEVQQKDNIVSSEYIKRLIKSSRTAQFLILNKGSIKEDILIKINNPFKIQKYQFQFMTRYQTHDLFNCSDPSKEVIPKHQWRMQVAVKLINDSLLIQIPDLDDIYIKLDTNDTVTIINTLLYKISRNITKTDLFYQMVYTGGIGSNLISIQANALFRMQQLLRDYDLNAMVKHRNPVHLYSNSIQNLYETNSYLSIQNALMEDLAANCDTNEKFFQNDQLQQSLASLIKQDIVNCSNLIKSGYPKYAQSIVQTKQKHYIQGIVNFIVKEVLNPFNETNCESAVYTQRLSSKWNTDLLQLIHNDQGCLDINSQSLYFHTKNILNMIQQIQGANIKIEQKLKYYLPYYLQYYSYKENECIQNSVLNSVLDKQHIHELSKHSTLQPEYNTILIQFLNLYVRELENAVLMGVSDNESKDKLLLEWHDVLGVQCIYSDQVNQSYWILYLLLLNQLFIYEIKGKKTQLYINTIKILNPVLYADKNELYRIIEIYGDYQPLYISDNKLQQLTSVTITKEQISNQQLTPRQPYIVWNELDILEILNYEKGNGSDLVRSIIPLIHRYHEQEKFRLLYKNTTESDFLIKIPPLERYFSLQLNNQYILLAAENIANAIKEAYEQILIDTPEIDIRIPVSRIKFIPSNLVYVFETGGNIQSKLIDDLIQERIEQEEPFFQQKYIITANQLIDTISLQYIIQNNAPLLQITNLQIQGQIIPDQDIPFRLIQKGSWSINIVILNKLQITCVIDSIKNIRDNRGSLQRFTNYKYSKKSINIIQTEFQGYDQTKEQEYFSDTADLCISGYQVINNLQKGVILNQSSLVVDQLPHINYSMVKALYLSKYTRQLNDDFLEQHLNSRSTVKQLYCQIRSIYDLNHLKVDNNYKYYDQEFIKYYPSDSKVQLNVQSVQPIIKEIDQIVTDIFNKPRLLYKDKEYEEYIQMCQNNIIYTINLIYNYPEEQIDKVTGEAYHPVYNTYCKSLGLCLYYLIFIILFTEYEKNSTGVNKLLQYVYKNRHFGQFLSLFNHLSFRLLNLLQTDKADDGSGNIISITPKLTNIELYKQQELLESIYKITDSVNSKPFTLDQLQNILKTMNEEQLPIFENNVIFKTDYILDLQGINIILFDTLQDIQLFESRDLGDIRDDSLGTDDLDNPKAYKFMFYIYLETVNPEHLNTYTVSNVIKQKGGIEQDLRCVVYRGYQKPVDSPYTLYDVSAIQDKQFNIVNNNQYIQDMQGLISQKVIDGYQVITFGFDQNYNESVNIKYNMLDEQMQLNIEDDMLYNKYVIEEHQNEQDPTNPQKFIIINSIINASENKKQKHNTQQNATVLYQFLKFIGSKPKTQQINQLLNEYLYEMAKNPSYNVANYTDLKNIVSLHGSSFVQQSIDNNTYLYLE